MIVIAMLVLLSALLVSGALAAPTVVNPRPAVAFVSGSDGSSCLATLYAPGFAVTTAACGRSAQQLHTDDGSTYAVTKAMGHGGVAALTVPGATAKAYASIGAWDFEAAWAAQATNAEMVSTAQGAAVTVPVVESPPESPARPAGMMAVSPVSGCPLMDGAPLFADDPSSQGSTFWMEVPLVGIVDASTSTCTTFSVITTASVTPFLTAPTRRALLQNENPATLGGAPAPTAAPAPEKRHPWLAPGEVLLPPLDSAPQAAVDAMSPKAAIEAPSPKAAMEATSPKAAMEASPPKAATDAVPQQAAVDATSPKAAMEAMPQNGAIDAMGATAPEAALATGEGRAYFASGRPDQMAPAAQSRVAPPPVTLSPGEASLPTPSATDAHALSPGGPGALAAQPALPPSLVSARAVLQPSSTGNGEVFIVKPRRDDYSDYGDARDGRYGDNWMTGFAVVALSLGLVAIVLAPACLCMNPKKI